MCGACVSNACKCIRELYVVGTVFANMLHVTVFLRKYDLFICVKVKDYLFICF